MTTQESMEQPGATLESRVSALESAVERLSALMEPGFAVAHIAQPVSTLILKEGSFHDYTGKFFALLDIGEALLKYSVSLAFGAVLDSANAPAEKIVELFKAPPSLGKLVGTFRTILDDNGLSRWPINEVRSVFRKANGKPTPTARYLLDEFISLRNGARGHSSQQSAGYYEDLYLKNYLIIQDCVRTCAFLSLPLVYVHSMDHAQGQYSYGVTMLMGASATNAKSAIITSAAVNVGSTCIWDKAAQLLSLKELVSYRYCPLCTVDHVFFADQITSESIEYHSYLGNHRVIVKRK